HEIDRERVGARSRRRADLERDVRRCAGLDVRRERRACPVPDHGLPGSVAPVIGDVDEIRTGRVPRGCAGVLEDDRHVIRAARDERRQRRRRDRGDETGERGDGDRVARREHATPSFTSAKRSRYAPGTGGAVTVEVTVADVFGSTAAASFVRGPSQSTVLPDASYQWRLRFTGFAPAMFHAWLPVFVSATAICALAPAGIVVGGVVTVYVALVVAEGTWTTYAALCANHATPSFTSAKLRRYAPGVTGAATMAVSVWLAPAATSFRRRVRGPSHMTELTAASYQW